MFFSLPVTDGDTKSDCVVLSYRYIDSLRVEVFRLLFLLAVLDHLSTMRYSQSSIYLFVMFYVFQFTCY